MRSLWNSWVVDWVLFLFLIRKDKFLVRAAPELLCTTNKPRSPSEVDFVENKGRNDSSECLPCTGLTGNLKYEMDVYAAGYMQITEVHAKNEVQIHQLGLQHIV